MKHLIFTMIMHLCITYTYADTKAIGLMWDRNPTNDNVINYRVYQSAIPGARTNSIATYDSGNTNVIRIPLSPKGEPRWYQVTALNQEGLESDPSNEIGYIVPWVTQSVTADGLVIRFKRFPNNSNVSYFLESSEDLMNWVDPVHLQINTTILQDGTEIVEATTNYSKPKEFYRVRVSIN